jgi:hypothetical protein
MCYGNWVEVHESIYFLFKIDVNKKAVIVGMKVTLKTKMFHVEHTPNLQVTAPKQKVIINGIEI